MDPAPPVATAVPDVVRAAVPAASNVAVNVPADSVKLTCVLPKTIDATVAVVEVSAAKLSASLSMESIVWVIVSAVAVRDPT
jgi:hypothetical protein